MSDERLEFLNKAINALTDPISKASRDLAHAKLQWEKHKKSRSGSGTAWKEKQQKAQDILDTLKELREQLRRERAAIMNVDAALTE